MKTTVNFFLLISSVLFGVFICEISLRLFYPKYEPPAETSYIGDSLAGWTPTANSRYTIMHPDTGVRHALYHNNMALRQHRDFDEAAIEAAVNVGFFGDSFLANIAIASQYSLTEPLDYLLNAGEQRFNVMNFGVEGYNTAQSFLAYKKFRYAHQLDYVFYLYVPNDLLNLGRRFQLTGEGVLTRKELNGKAGKTSNTSWWTKLMSGLHVTYLFMDATRRLALMSVDEDQRRIFLEILRSWKQSVEKRGGRFFVATLPARNLNLDKTAIEDEFDVIDLHDCFRNRVDYESNRSSYWLKNNGHWSEGGNRLAAVCLYRFIEHEAGIRPLSEQQLGNALHRYYSSFDNWMPSSGDVNRTPFPVPSIAAKDAIRKKYLALEVNVPLPDNAGYAFDVRLEGQKLVYKKKPCMEKHTEPLFFLTFEKVDLNDPQEIRAPRVIRFFFDTHGRHVGDECIVELEIGQHPVSYVRTGQYVRNLRVSRLWEVEIDDRNAQR